MGSTVSSNRKSERQQHEALLMKLSREQSANGIDKELELILSDPRRLVFVSLFGLFRTYKQTPVILLYSSLFVLPIKKRWIYDPLKFRAEFNESIIGLQDPAELEQFLDLLRWKDSQHLLFCQLDAFDAKGTAATDKELIASFWRYFSARLVSLKLNALNLDAGSIWSVGKPSAAAFQSDFNTTHLAVLTELCCLTMRYAPMQHIIYSSNPRSLKPIVSYSAPTATNNNSETQKALFLPSKLDGKDGSVWYISTDYETE